MSYRVLICDDSSLARKMSRRCLPNGFASEVVAAENGQQAIQLLTETTYDLLLLDLTMPVLDGVGVLTKIKELELEIFTIVVSGDIQPNMQQRVMALGALDFLSKPIDPARIEKTLTKFGFI